MQKSIMFATGNKEKNLKKQQHKEMICALEVRQFGNFRNFQEKKCS
jgi:hypothetical protein